MDTTDAIQIPMNTLSNNSRTEYRISNPNNPYLISAMANNKARKSSMGHKSYGYANDIFEPSPLKAWAQVKDHHLVVNGLPTLEQVLTRKTRHPLSLHNFDEFLRQQNADANLAFWRDVYNHQKLWASLQANIARRKRKSESESASSFRRSKSSSHYSSSYDTGSLLAALQETQLSHSADPTAYHIETANKHVITSPRSPEEEEETGNHYSEITDTLELLEDSSSSIFIPQSLYSYKRVTATSMLCYEDLQQNAKRIFYKFCTPHQPESKIYIPDDYRLALQEMIAIHQLADPVIFDSSFSHIFEVLNIFFYGRFLESVMYKNVSTFTTRIYMTLGVIFLTAGFALELALILLGYGTRATRLWGMLPIFLGFCMLIANIGEFAWWLGFLNVRYV
ncbi:hypothetical protein Unana1_04628 [Umbelopsis nana]